MIKNLRMFLVTILCFLFSVANTCRSDYTNREVHLVVSYDGRYIGYLIDYRLIKDGKIENRKHVEFQVKHDYIDINNIFYISKNIEVLKFIDNLFEEVPWGSSMPQINDTQVVTPSGNRQILIKEEIIEPITHFINSGKFETY